MGSPTTILGLPFALMLEADEVAPPTTAAVVVLLLLLLLFGTIPVL